jgi:hypothetical protein
MGKGKQPEFPVVSGEYRMTEEWSILLSGEFKRRFEDDSLVLWRSGLTAWVMVWGNDYSESPSVRLEHVRADSSPERFDEVVEEDGGILRYAYRLQEEAHDDRVSAFYGFAFGESGHVQMAIYFDAEDDLKHARALWKGIRERKA